MVEEEEGKDYSDYITVVSYNVRQLNLGDRIDDIVALIKQMDGDIVGLQEVSEGGVTSENMVKLLARLCGYDYSYFCVMPFGNGKGYVAGKICESGRQLLLRRVVL